MRSQPQDKIAFRGETVDNNKVEHTGGNTSERGAVGENFANDKWALCSDMSHSFH
jgi:hypothetical protein